jgi:hypothetical protein
VADVNSGLTFTNHGDPVDTLTVSEILNGDIVATSQTITVTDPPVSGGGTIVSDPPVSAPSENTSVQSTSAHDLIVSSLFAETLSGNGDRSAFLFKATLDHHITDQEINFAQSKAENLVHLPAQPEDNGVLAVTDGAHPADLPVDVNQLPSFKFADDGSAHPGTVPYGPPTLTALSSDSGGDHGPPASALAKTFNASGMVMSDAAPDKFIFAENVGHDTVADHKPDMTEIDHSVPAEIQHLLDTAHDTNAVSTLDPNHATAPQDITKVQLPHHQGDFHFA